MRAKKGYSSHGMWSTFGEIKELELERGNKFPSFDFPKETPTIWVSLSRRLGLRYLLPASEWDRISDINNPLTPKERKMMLEELTTIDIKPTDVLWEGADKGFLLIRKKK